MRDRLWNIVYILNHYLMEKWLFFLSDILQFNFTVWVGKQNKRNFGFEKTDDDNYIRHTSSGIFNKR